MLPTLPPRVGIGEGGEAGVCGSVLPPTAVHGSVGVREEKQVKRRFEAVPVLPGRFFFALFRVGFRPDLVVFRGRGGGGYESGSEGGVSAENTAKIKRLIYIYLLTFTLTYAILYARGDNHDDIQKRNRLCPCFH